MSEPDITTERDVKARLDLKAGYQTGTSAVTDCDNLHVFLHYKAMSTKKFCNSRKLDIALNGNPKVIFKKCNDSIGEFLNL